MVNSALQHFVSVQKNLQLHKILTILTFQVCSRNSDGSVFNHRSSLFRISFITILILCLVKYSYPAAIIMSGGDGEADLLWSPDPNQAIVVWICSLSPKQMVD